MQTLIDNESLRVSVIPHDSGVAVLCFTGVGFGIGGVDIQSEEFYRVSSGATAIFIIDKKRTWGNGIDFDQIKEVIQPYIEGKTLYSLGNSMGGFLAVLSSRFFDLAAAVAFVPQYTVSKRVMPEEYRWAEYICNIEGWRFESLAGAFRPEAEYYVLTGSDPDDARQAAMYPNLPNVHKIVFSDPAFAHDLGAVLKERGLLYEIISACFSLKGPEEVQAVVESVMSP